MRLALNLIFTLALVVFYTIMGFLIDYKISPDIVLEQLDNVDSSAHIAENLTSYISYAKYVVLSVWLIVMVAYNKNYVLKKMEENSKGELK